MISGAIACYARGQSMDVCFVNIIGSVVRTYVKPSFPSGPIGRSCSSFRLLLLPWTAPCAISASTRFLGFVETLVDGQAIFALVVCRGTTLFLRLVLHDISQQQVVDARGQALHDPSQQQTPLISAHRSSDACERSQRPIGGAPSLQPETRVLIEPRLDRCSVVPRLQDVPIHM